MYKIDWDLVNIFVSHKWAVVCNILNFFSKGEKRRTQKKILNRKTKKYNKVGNIIEKTNLHGQEDVVNHWSSVLLLDSIKVVLNDCMKKKQ